MRRIRMTADEVRQAQLGIMDKIDEFCTREGISYSLDGGSLLGAVRHKGFIPWDDDMDVIMPRADYDRFWQVFNGAYEHFKVVNYRLDPDFAHTFTRVIDTRTLALDHNRVNKYGIFVDIYAVDGQPEDDKAFDDYVRTYIRLKNQFHKSAPLWHCTDSPLVALKTLLRHPFYPPREETARALEALYQSYPMGSTAYAGHIMGGSEWDTHMPATVFDEYIRLPFEGRMYRCVKDYDTFLKKLYGDYMQLPPESERHPYHSVACYRLEP